MAVKEVIREEKECRRYKRTQKVSEATEISPFDASLLHAKAFQQLLSRSGGSTAGLLKPRVRGHLPNSDCSEHISNFKLHAAQAQRRRHQATGGQPVRFYLAMKSQ